MSEKSKPTEPPPPYEQSRRDLLARADELSAIITRLTITRGDLIMTAERMPGGSVR